ncbi:MAG: hypothetical protein AAB444_01215 [Patescibacteria group bacterium]
MGLLSRWNAILGREHGGGATEQGASQVTRGEESEGKAGSMEEAYSRYLAGETTPDQMAEMSRMSIEDVANKRLEVASGAFSAFQSRYGAGLSRIVDKTAYAVKIGVFAPDVLAARAGEAISANVKQGVNVTVEAAKKGAMATSEFVGDQYYFTRARAKKATQAVGDFAWNSGGQEAAHFGRDFGEAVRVMSTGESWKQLGRGAIEKAQEFGAGVKYIAADLPKDEVNKFCAVRLGKTSGELWGDGKETVSQALGEVKDTVSSKYDAAAEWTTLKTAELAFDARMSFLRMEKRVSDTRGWASKRVGAWKLERAEAKIIEVQRDLEARRWSLAKLQEKVLAGENA